MMNFDALMPFSGVSSAGMSLRMSRPTKTQLSPATKPLAFSTKHRTRCRTGCTTREPSTQQCRAADHRLRGHREGRSCSAAPITGMVCRASAIPAAQLLTVPTPPVCRLRATAKMVFRVPPRRMHRGQPPPASHQPPGHQPTTEPSSVGALLCSIAYRIPPREQYRSPARTPHRPAAGRPARGGLQAGWSWVLQLYSCARIYIMIILVASCILVGGIPLRVPFIVSTP